MTNAWDHWSLAFHHISHALAVSFRCCTCKPTSRAKKKVSPSRRPSMEEDTAPPQPCCIVDPSATWKGRWDLLIMVLILYSAVTVPVHIGFNSDSTGAMWLLEMMMSLLFMADLVLTFRTAYLDDSVWVRDPGRIARNYLSGWFWIDGPSSVPVELIELAMPTPEDSSSSLGLLRFLRMFRLVRLLRLLKIDKYMSRLEEMLDVNLRALRVVQLVLKMSFIAHLQACSWFYVGSFTVDPELHETWVRTYDEGSAVDAPLSKQYLYCIYWALTTLTTVRQHERWRTHAVHACQSVQRDDRVRGRAHCRRWATATSRHKTTSSAAS